MKTFNNNVCSSFKKLFDNLYHILKIRLIDRIDDLKYFIVFYFYTKYQFILILNLLRLINLYSFNNNSLTLNFKKITG